MATSLLSPRDITAIKRLRVDAFATRQALADPPIDLVLERGETVLAAQRVVLKHADRQPQRSEGEAAVATFAEGTFAKELPFDVAVDDRFVLGGKPGVIVAVPLAQNGVQVASWRLDIGSV